MRYCPICKQCYDDTEMRCGKDGLYLVEAFPGSRVVGGKYRIDALLGQGGMGSVYRATHLELDRIIALKIVLPDFVSNNETLERFRQEARASARLNHPNVISVYDFGILPTGQAYLAMELLGGRSLREEIEKNITLSPERIIEVLGPVCNAVNAAHLAGVIHRDLKPDNIIIETTDRDEELIKVVDFGIAKLKERSGITSAPTNLTEPGLVMGTPHYMSPEQCRGEELDACSDIYSLGITIYEMLVGHVPFDAPTPSAVIIQHAIDPPPPLRRLRPDIPEEIERVVLRALAKGREYRQQTTTQLFEEFLAAVREARETADSLKLGKIGTGTGLPVFSDEPVSPTGNDVLDLTHQPLPETVSLSEVATFSGHEHVVKSLAFHGSGEWLVSASGDGTIRLWDVAEKREVNAFVGHEYSVNSVAFSPDGLRVASGGADGTARIWSIRGAREIASFGHRTAVRAVTFTPDGRWLAAACDAEVKIWDASRFRQITSFVGHVKTVDALAISPDGGMLATGGADDTIHLWSLISKTEQAVFTRPGHAPTALVYLPHRNIVVSGGRDSAICLWSGQGGNEPLHVLSGHRESVRALAVSPNGTWLASADWNGLVNLWSLTSGEIVTSVEAHDGAAQALAFSPEGNLLVSGGADALIKLWNLG
jgi:WD40 repeat protein